MNAVKLLEGRQPVYDNSAKNTAMYIVRFERNARDGLKPKIIMKNDNSHLQLKLDGAQPATNEEEKKQAPVTSARAS